MGPDERQAAQQRLLDELTALAEDANFERISTDDLDRAFVEESLLKVRLESATFDFEVDDGVGKLRRLRLVDDDGQGRLTAVTLDEANAASTRPGTTCSPTMHARARPSCETLHPAGQ